MSELVGLEVLFSSRSSEIRCKSDALVLAIHWTLVIAGLRSTNVQTEGGEAGETSELLPSGWNEKSEDVYTLRYVRKEKNETYLIKIVFADGILIVNSLKNDKQTSSTTFIVDHFVHDHNTRFQSVYRNLNELRNEIVERLIGTPIQKSVPTKPSRRCEHTGSEESNPIGIPCRNPNLMGSSWLDDDRSPLPAVGRGDLHPLGGPPGMLMDPRSLIQPNRPENLQRGTIPGARFDPYGPSVPDDERRRFPPFGGPTPDHLPPPGYDDMFL